ncbi:MAG TPA: heparinase II/III family protein, partial [Arachidicoccus sp.]|nr:heparinase II/III family protein [Arachidicoccus sp.]
MLRRLWLILHTVRYLRFKQIWFQIFYRIEKPKPLFAYDDQFESEKLTPLLFSEKPPVFVSVIDILGNGFSFLNLEKKFGTTIDWNEQSLGRLWNYNLQYCNFLLQDEIPYDIRITWLVDLYVNLYEGQVPIEPYPSSLRSINVIRLMTIHGVDEEILPYLHSELDFLEKHLEFHLLGNHLLENLFTLFMGGAFFDEVKWYNRAQKLLIEQLDEQILEDGGHFELSPMYHQIILFRLLELIDWYSTWRRKENGIEVYLKGKAESMLSWIKKMSFKNGNIPHFNDSAEGISYNTQWLLQYGLALGLNATVNLP